MGLAMCALFILGLASLAIAAVAWFLFLRRLRSKHFKELSAVGIIVASFVILVFFFAQPTFHWLLATTVKQGTGVSLLQYQGTGPRLPAGATQITYYSDYQGTEAGFCIKENELVQWATANGWKTQEFTAPEPVRWHHLEIRPAVARGLRIDELFSPNGAGIHILFDRDAGECIFRFNSY